MTVMMIGRLTIVVAFLLGATHLVFAQDAKTSQAELDTILRKLNDPAVQQRVGAAVQDAALQQLSKEGVKLSPEVLALLAERVQKKDPADTLAAGAVFVATVAMFSDATLKEDIKLYGMSPSGISVYEFSYKGFTTRWRGVLAQEIVASHPDAVHRARNGYLMVDYQKLDVKFERVPQ